MAHMDNDSIHDDLYLSEDSESIQSTYSDLDYNLNIEVLMPDGSIQNTSIPAHTPWGDVRTHLCSQFKLSPSSHVVDFISDSTKNKKRKASLPVGRLNITMVTIKVKGHQTKHAAPPPPVINADQGSVRLIVRLPRQRQSILRVNPDVPLSIIFTNISNKLKLDGDSKDHAEFRHPEQHNVKLNSKLSLNHYNLREVYLAPNHETAEATPTPNHNATPIKAKRKAPPPPRPPPPSLSARSKSTSSATDSNPPAEPVYAQVQKKPKPKKRRSAPTVPQTIVPDGEKSETALPANTTDLQNDKPLAPTRRTLKMHKALEDTFKEEETSECRNDVVGKANNVTQSETRIEDDAYLYATIEDLDKVEEKNDVIDENDDDVIADDNVLQSIDEVLESDAEKNIDSDEEEKEDALNSIDDVLEKFVDVTVSDGKADDEHSDSKQDESTIESDKEKEREKNLHPPHDSNTVFESSLGNDVIAREHVGDEFSTSDIDLAFNLPTSTVQEEEPTSVHEKIPLHPVTSLPLKEGINSSTLETVLKPGDVPRDVPQEKGERESPSDDFDLRIAESFNIPIQSIDEKQASLNKDTHKVKNDQAPDQPKIETKQIVPPKPEAKSAIEMENDKTAKEIEKLHRQIKMMRNRNSVKQMEADAARSNWQSGSFMFVPTKKPETSHDDYDVAPVNAIALSNDGEMKPLNKDDKKEADTAPVVRAEALPRKDKLPNYYKKFLGAQAFAAKESK